MEKNQATFGKPKYGLHGKALPNFYVKPSTIAGSASKSPTVTRDRSADAKQQETIPWWKNQDGYTEMPKNVSHRQLNREKKYWASPDKYYLSELTK